ncbi:MAG: sigma-70 family RNA polymerase sigma factor [Candidatus Blackburnbacteria bacterium]|nr:sigma-70 family RNA polymerase sigma factor [Candidatus Blackburnbacteria bacterium]
MTVEQRGSLFYLDTKGGLALLDEDPEQLDLALPNPDIHPTNGEKRPSDTFNQYLREISKTPLLTAQEEVKLALQIETAKTYLVKNMPSLPSDIPLGQALLRKVAEEKPSLLPIVQAGVEAREHMIKANLRLVVSIAKRKVGKGLPLVDLVQEGNLGLFKAIEKFDPRIGYKFSTYATWWIRQAITRAFSDQSRNIRLPVHIGEEKGRLVNATLALTQELGETPTHAQIANRLNKHLRKGKRPYTAESVSFLFQALKLEPIPMSWGIKGDKKEDDMELGDVIPDEHVDVEKEASHTFLRDDLLKQLAHLSPREQTIMKLRHGLMWDGEIRPPLTLEEIGKLIDLTRERVRQIEDEALTKLRKLPTIWHLREYLE